MNNYLIWSNEHTAWWRPDHAGYCYDIAEAGRYSRDEAIKICKGANYGFTHEDNPNEIPVLEIDAIEAVNAKRRVA